MRPCFTGNKRVRLILSTTVKGRIGEYIAAAAIEGQGWQTSLAPMEDIDLLAFSGNRFLRVQVKAASPLNSRKGANDKSYAFFLNPKSEDRASRIDLYAFVALDQRRVTFAPAKNLSGRTKRISPRNFGSEEQSFAAAVNEIFPTLN